MSYCRKHFLNRAALITIEVGLNLNVHFLGCNSSSCYCVTVSPFQDMKLELMKMMEQAGFWSSRHSTHFKLHAGSLSKPQNSILNAVLTAGLYDNVARVVYTPSVDVLERVACTVETLQGKAQVHPSSVNRMLQTHGWLLYQEKVCACVCEA